MKPILEPILYRLRATKVKGFIPKNSLVCDIGCGENGTFLFEIKNYIKAGVGYDKEVTPINTDKIVLKKSELTQSIDESSEFFDCVVLMAVLEHLSNLEAIMKECYRILRAGGRLLLTTPAPKSKAVLEILSFKLGFVSSYLMKEHKHYFSQDELKQVLIKAGFLAEKITVTPFELGYNHFVLAIK